MIRRALVLAFLLLPLAVRAQDSTPRLEIAYEVDVTKPETGVVRVTMKILRNTADEIDVSMPTWNPGSYRLQPHYRNVRNFTARTTDRAPFRQLDEMTWRIQAGKRDVTVEYEVGVPSDRLDKDHYFFEGPSLYMYVVDGKDAPCRVSFKLPEGWKVGTGLDSKDGWYSARDYDTFIDCPTELGRFALHEFQQDGVRYEIVVHSIGDYDVQGLIDCCRKIVKSQNAMFGGAPFDRYVFLFHFRKGMGGGGLEHLNSTNITLGYDFVKSNIWNVASITSHEYFHLWNVKRIRPKELGPFDYTGVVRSRHLWLMEGVTSYYGDLTLARTGIWDEARYFRHLADEIQIHNDNPDRKVTSVERASERVWDRTDWPRVDYYNKGELLGLLLDLKIRLITENQKNFDDVMRYLYDRYVVKGGGPIGVGFEQTGILKAINAVSGSDFTDFYKRYIQGVEDLPFEEILKEAGLDVKLTVQASPTIPVALRGSVVASVTEGSEAEAAGLKAGDRITKINGAEVTRDTFRTLLDKMKAGDKARLTVQRGSDTVEVTIKVGQTERWRCTISRLANPTEKQKKIVDSWLGK
jgi:predicted metalloprotease with PDZ domain